MGKFREISDIVEAKLKEILDFELKGKYHFIFSKIEILPESENLITFYTSFFLLKQDQPYPSFTADFEITAPITSQPDQANEITRNDFKICEDGYSFSVNLSSLKQNGLVTMVERAFRSHGQLSGAPMYQ
eukprot:gnl/Dysnectes_brevis/5217_a7401_601.p1 GENE.gnl/Dysnectes_brevis/5217_a7401_601~~gnl/Dysnectes_brevis/5217_a7401_601.p1  ORF type:complete len:130 (-),score=1.76 gnl/Dysnectes_brevis/5217_a7401_601:23-412(-)